MRREEKKKDVYLVQILIAVTVEERKGIVLTVTIRDSANNFGGCVKQGWNNDLYWRKY